MNRNCNMKKLVGSIAAVYISLMALIACSNPEGEFFYGTLGLGDKKILVATANAGALTVVLYDIDGRLVDVVRDYTFTNDVPRGIAVFDAFNFMILLDGVDRLQKVSLKGLPAADYADPGLNGGLFQLTYDPMGQRYFGIEGNFIEGFSKAGLRIGNPIINTTVGACVLNIPRGVFATNDSRLLVVGTGNDRLNIYNISTTTPTCVSTNTSIGAVDPVAVIQHSNSLIYFADQVNDRVSSLPSDGSGSPAIVWATDLTTINNPTALLEMPDGTMLVASDGTNSIERITIGGVRVGSTPFIRDAFSGLVSQMMLIGGE
jgi:hypothetical protein